MNSGSDLRQDPRVGRGEYPQLISVLLLIGLLYVNFSNRSFYFDSITYSQAIERGSVLRLRVATSSRAQLIVNGCVLAEGEVVQVVGKRALSIGEVL